MTGASSGLGAALARKLAQSGQCNLLLTARRAEKLIALKSELESAHGIQVRVSPCDLSNMAEVDKLAAEARGLPLSAAVLNAGMTYLGTQDMLSWEAFDDMVNLNIRGTVRMVNHLVADLRRKSQTSRILIVASMAGLVPVAFQSAYSGTKAFLVSFGSALSEELRGSRVSVGIFAPGGIATEMTAGSGFDTLRGWLAPVEQVAEAAERALRNDSLVSTPGFSNALGALLFRLLPRRFVLRMVGREYRSAIAARAALGEGRAKADS